MFKYLILIWACLLASVAPMQSQEPHIQGSIEVQPIRFQLLGDSLYINIDFEIRGHSVDPRKSTHLIPLLTSDEKSLPLPELRLMSRAEYRAHQRSQVLMNQKERAHYDSTAPYALYRVHQEEEPICVFYTQVLAAEPWMLNAKLDLLEDRCGCGDPARRLWVKTLVNCIQSTQTKIEPYMVKPLLAYIQPVAEAVKRRQKVGEAFLDFVVSKTEIHPEYMNNPRELKKITDMMEELRADSSIVVRGISIQGYASPEGRQETNQRLSEDRALALMNYLEPRFDFPRSLYHQAFGGENWDGLRALVPEIDIPYKAEVVDLLDRTDISNETRKTLLKKLRKGQPYAILLKDYFPRLRKAICTFEYEVKGFDIIKALEMFKTHPQYLSLNEMYLIAQTHAVGSLEFTEVFETAVRMFPSDETANLNAATAVLSRNDTLAAERYLQKVKTPSPQYHNTQGVLRMLQERYPEAETLLHQAAQAGLPEAQENLIELNKRLESIQRIKEQSEQEQKQKNP